MAGNCEFDAFLGGAQNLPNEMSIEKFASSRSQEIAALSQIVDTSPHQAGLVFQRLPKHMQRRAMSHNAKRLPRRLREIHTRQLSKGGEIGKSKRPSRKHRRRPTNLLSEYNRRQRQWAWLETHIWHAKRFHMVNKWGYRVPSRPVDKSFRACYRAGANHCLVQDISYYCCIELCGPEEVLLIGLEQLTNADCGLTFGAKVYLGGSREGSTMLYQRGKYPCGAIGCSWYLWKPHEGGVVRTLWVWLHPAYYEQALQEMLSVFELQVAEQQGAIEVQEMDVPDVLDTQDLKETKSKKKTRAAKKVEVEDTKLEVRNVPFVRTPHYTSVDGTVHLVELKDTLNRIRLTGPLSHSVLTGALTVSGLEGPCADAWTILGQVMVPAEIPPRVVVGLVIRDPRLHMPPTKVKAPPSSSDMRGSVHVFPADCNKSSIWDPASRDSATAAKLSADDVARLHGSCLVPGEGGGVAEQGPEIPLLLVHRPGGQKHRLGFSSGWDIIAPCGYGMPLWLGLHFQGARAGGLRDASALEFESRQESPLPPDTAAGRIEAKTLQAQLFDKHFRKPPDKRPNFIKLGITSPFLCEWDILVQEWCGPGIEWYVWRSRHGPGEMQPGCLISVTLHTIGRGAPDPCAIICLPTTKDLEKQENPLEPVHMDHHRDERRLQRARQSVLLNQKKRLRKKLRKNGKEAEPSENTDAGTINELWLPETTCVKDSCSRTVIGFVTRGDFSFMQGCGLGVGYVILEGLRTLRTMKSSPIVLYRNPTSLQYYRATLDFDSQHL
uniref:Uncharacterized protein n=1 Tax=Timema cristinae TaxID=61476 RepID=A0A7R9CU54_TIMCR|nr:unnamed protein product [Timema cristinae]